MSEDLFVPVHDKRYLLTQVRLKKLAISMSSVADLIMKARLIVPITISQGLVASVTNGSCFKRLIHADVRKPVSLTCLSTVKLKGSYPHEAAQRLTTKHKYICHSHFSQTVQSSTHYSNVYPHKTQSYLGLSLIGNGIEPYSKHSSVRHFHNSGVCIAGKSPEVDKASHFRPPYPTLPAQSSDTLIETWFYTVAPKGTLNLNVPFTTILRPLDPQSHPNMDKVIIEMHFDRSRTLVEGAEKIPSSHELSCMADMYNLDIAFDESSAKMNLTGRITTGVELPLVCLMWVPLKSDLFASITCDKDMTVENLESDVVNLTADNGTCNLKSMKVGSINVQCRGGDIVSHSTVLGNVVFQTGNTGSIRADKLQGSSVICETEMGSISVKSLYTETAVTRTTAGSINLGQCHGQMLVQAGQADVIIGSLEGDIDIDLHTGNVELHLSRHSKSNINVKDGNVDLSFPESVNTDISLDSSNVTVGDNTAVTFLETDQPHHKEGYIGKKNVASVHARTLSGNINVKCLDWIHTTKLAFMNNSET